MRTKSLKFVFVVAIFSLMSLSVMATGTEPFAKIETKENSTTVLMRLSTNEADVTIKDSKGNILFSDFIANAKNVVRPYNLEKLDDGIYFIEVENQVQGNIHQVTIEDENVVLERNIETYYKPIFDLNEEYLAINLMTLGEKASLKLIDVQDHVIFDENIDSVSFHRILNLSNLKEGFYHAQVYVGERVYSKVFSHKR